MLGYKKDEKKDALFSSHEASYIKEEASVRYRTFLCRDSIRGGPSLSDAFCHLGT